MLREIKERERKERAYILVKFYLKDKASIELHADCILQMP